MIAAGLIPELSSDRVKNDRLDAEKLARYFSKGLLTPVHLPSEDDEQERMVVRSRTFLKEQLKDFKKNIVSVSKQLGWSYREERGEGAAYWTGAHRMWLRAQLSGASRAVTVNFEILHSQIDALEARIDEYEARIRETAALPKYEEKVKSLICYRGIDVLTAMVLITELGDIRRFPHPQKLVSYVGLDIAEYSSGGKERRFSLTKMGNKRVRKMLTESVQTANRPPLIGRELKKRREGTDLKYIDVADRCMKRLNKRAVHLLYKGKPVKKIKSACAGEMICFIWESLNLAS